MPPTLLIVDAILNRRVTDREKTELRLGLGSRQNSAAVDALRRLRVLVRRL